tara:strand:- start:17867 stop:19699 length:1833 start_codon:yes stop_codon:yes gene_type:complete
MVTTIQSTQLDFATIKDSLKTYLSQKTEFSDYNFEASGLSNILDVLAHNTHYNGLIANFAMNEAFLNTAQLRSSVVSHAESLGYNPRSITSAIGYINISTTITAGGRPSSITLPRNTKFTAAVDDISYSFYTLESYTANDDGAGNYTFLNASGTSSIPVVEGTLKVKTFYAGSATDRQIYVIPDATIDTSSAQINVYLSNSSSFYTTYGKLFDAITIDANSTLYQLREAPNGNYELIFSDGITTGKAPATGNKIVLQYLSSNGSMANTASQFTPVSTITVGDTSYNLTATTVTSAAGGSNKESIEAIRHNAPITFAAQQRLVTADDYKALILSKFNVVDDCIAWGGEDNIPPVYGKVFVSLKFPDYMSDDSKNIIKNSIQTNLIKPLSIMTIGADFVDPTITYVECETFFRFNPNKTNITLKTAETAVQTIVNTYFVDSLNQFSEPFRRSNILTKIDNYGDAILNSRMDIKLQQRFTPTLGTSGSYNVYFPISIAIPNGVDYIITSNNFTYNNKICSIRNVLNSNVLQIVDSDSVVQVNNIGTYNANTGTVNITGFNPTSISGGQSYIRISIIPSNQSTIIPLRNYILNIDTSKSFASGILDYGKTQVAL